MTAFNVYQGRKKLDTVTYAGNFTADEVRKSLVERGEFPGDIRVTKARLPSTTEVQHIVQCHYGAGWEDVAASTDYKEAKRDLKSYRENHAYPSRLIKRRVKLDQQ